MDVTPLRIADAFRISPVQFPDSRGVFLESFRQDILAQHIGHEMAVRQTNCSVSGAGVVRGIHFADIPPSQAKYVTCVLGAVFDVVVDIRIGSPTYGAWDAVLLDGTSREAVYVAEGLGHGFMALTDGAVVTYLCSAPYAPGREHGVNPLDPDIGVAWPTSAPDGRALSPLLSQKDAAAPSLAEAAEAGLLPTWAEARDFYSRL